MQVDNVTLPSRKVERKTTLEQQIIGLFGLGNVGAGLYRVMQDVPSEKAFIKRVCVKHPEKKRELDVNMLTTDSADILNDEEINLVVELIDDADEAYRIVKAALLKGKSVVSGNKTMLAHRLDELIEIQNYTGAALLYDASACGSIPVIRNLEEYYDNDLLLSIDGILNGSTNYILSRIFNYGDTFDLALKRAQELGFAESDPSFDVMGYDALYKLIILTVHGFGVYVKPDRVFCYGITGLTDFDLRFAREKEGKVKLVAHVLKVDESHFTQFVMPTLVKPDDHVYNVENEFNGVVIRGQYYDSQFMFGKGAGGFPTASAVLSDISARLHGYRYEYKKLNLFIPPSYTTDVTLQVYIRYHDMVDLTIFGIEEVEERYSCSDFRWVIARVNLATLIRINELIPKLNLFVVYLGNTHYIGK